MKVGVQDPCLVPAASVRAGYGLARRARADSFWLPDHIINIVPKALWQRKNHAAASLTPNLDGFFEPLVMMGTLAMQSRKTGMTLGTSVIGASRRHPALTAQAFASLQLLTKGRVILGIGTGARENNTPYGIEWSSPVGQLEEALRIIRLLWDSDGSPVTHESRWWPLRDAVFDIPPYKGARPPIWIAAQGPQMLRVAGRWGDGWLPMVSFSPDDQSFPSLQAPKGYGARLDALRSAAADCGRDPSGVVASGWFFVLTAPTRSTVDDLLHTPIARAMALGVPAHRWAPFGAEHPLGADFAGGHDLLPQTLDDAALEHALAAVPEGLLRSAVFAGTPSELAERFIEYRDQGLAHPVLLNGSLLSQLGGGLLSVPAFLRLVKLLRKM